jgi:hypothetical protein
MNPRRLLYFLLSAAIGGAAGVLLARGGALRYFESSHRAFGPLPILAAEALVLWAVISTHEGGHLLAATLVGFRGLLYVSGPLHVYRDDTGWRLRLNRNFALYGGIVSALPLTMDRLRQRLLMMVAGGPVASLLSGVIAWTLLASTAPASLSRALLGSYAFVSLAIGVITLIPARSIGYLTDGGQLVRLIRGGAEVERDNAVMCLVAASYAGTRPRDWDRGVVAVVTQPSEDPRERLTAARYAFGYALDMGDIDVARGHLAVVLADVDLLPRPIQAMMLVSAGYFAARYDRSSTTARRYVDRARQIWTMPASSTSITDAAIALLENRLGLVPPLLAVAENSIAHSIDRGNVRVAREMIASLRAEAAQLASRAAGD